MKKLKVKVMDFERKIGVLETNEVEESNKRIRVDGR